MTQEELKRKTYLDKAIDRRNTQKAAAETLGFSERQVSRLIRRYRQDSSKGLVSHQRGKPSNRRMKEELVAQIRQFIHQPSMEGFKPTFIREKLAEATGISVSKETLRRLMISENLHIAKARKSTGGSVCQACPCRWLETCCPYSFISPCQSPLENLWKETEWQAFSCD